MRKDNLIPILYNVLAAIGGVVALFLLALIFIGGRSLGSPYFMLLMAVLLCAGISAVLVRKFFAPAVKYPLGKGVKFEDSTLVKLAKWLPLGLCITALFLSVLALSRPRKEGKSVLPPAKGVDIMLTIDTSGSMAALDFKPDRMTAAKSTASDFVDKRATDRIGVVVFAGSAMLQCPLTLDYFAVKEYIDLINIDMLSDQLGTAIGDAIAVSAKHLKDSIAKSKTIILLTDGENNTGMVDPIAAAKAAAAYGIKIYTISIASGEPADMKVNTQSIFGPVSATTQLPPPSPESEATLMQIAKETGGDFFRAKNNAELQNIYTRINELEKTEFDSSLQLNYTDNYKPALITAILLLVAAFIADKFIFIKIP